jgi:hypothetical protein
MKLTERFPFILLAFIVFTHPPTRSQVLRQDLGDFISLYVQTLLLYAYAYHSLLLFYEQ